MRNSVGQVVLAIKTGRLLLGQVDLSIVDLHEDADLRGNLSKPLFCMKSFKTFNLSKINYRNFYFDDKTFILANF